MGRPSLIHLLPGPTLLFSLALAVVMLCLVVAKGGLDSDYFWHLRTGQLIVETGSVPRVDPFSFTWEGQPWTAYSWLSEVALHWLVSVLGEPGTLLLFAASPGVIFGVLAAALARLGLRTLAIAAPIALAAWTLLPYVTLRPQVASWTLTAILLSALLTARPDRRWPLFALPLLMVLWANLHGAWVVGLAVIALYALMTIAGRTAMSSSRGSVLVVAALCVAAAALTPAGPAGVLYPLRYLDPASWALENIAEWQSPNFHDPTHWSLLALIVAIALNRGLGTPAWLALLPVIGIVMSLSSIRNVPFLAIWSVPTLAMGLDARLRSRWPRQSRDTEPTRRLLEVGATLLVVLVVLTALFPTDLSTRIARETAARYPVDGLNALEAAHPGARVFADYNWGGYVIARLHDRGGRVFVDGRDGEMYPVSILEDYNRLFAADPGWEGVLEEYGVEAVLLRPEAPLVNGPIQLLGWCEAYRDGRQVLLLPSGCARASSTG